MTPLQRDLTALVGVAFLAVGLYLVLPALAFLLIGAALLWFWYCSVPAEADETTQSETASSFDQTYFETTVQEARRYEATRQERLADSAVRAEARDLSTTARAVPTAERQNLPGVTGFVRRLGIPLTRKDAPQWPR